MSDEDSSWSSRVVMSGIAVLFTLVVGLAINTGARTNEALDDLRSAIYGLTTKLAILETKLLNIPDSMGFRLNALETKMNRLEQHVSGESLLNGKNHTHD